MFLFTYVHCENKQKQVLNNENLLSYLLLFYNLFNISSVVAEIWISVYKRMAAQLFSENTEYVRLCCILLNDSGGVSVRSRLSLHSILVKQQ